MKAKQFITPFFLLSALVLTACGSEVSPTGEGKAEDVELKVNNSNVNFDTEREITVSVTATKDLSWEAKTESSWIHLSTTSGTGSGTITISVTEDNPSTNSRNGTVTLSSSRYNRSVSIQVEQVGTWLTVEPDNLTMLTSGGTRSLTIKSNVSWYVKSKSSWVELSVLDGQPGTTNTSVKATANPQANERSGELIIETQNGVVNKTVKLTQEPVKLTLSDEKIIVAPEGVSRTVDIACNSEWTASSNAAWCKVNPANGTDDGTVSVTVSENTSTVARTATITFKAGQISKTMSVEQASATLGLGSSSLSYPSAGGSEIVQVNTNTTWTATSNKDWCTVSADATSGNGTLTVIVSKNNTIQPRQATVTVKALGLTAQITINQQAGVVAPGDDDNPMPQYSRYQK